MTPAASDTLALCVCGSGLRTFRCCALDPSALGPLDSEAHRHLVPVMERAAAARRQSATATAERLCIELLELSPGYRDALWMLSRIRDEQGAGGAAEALVRRLVGLNPNGLAATQDLALRLLRRGAMSEAEAHARNAVRLAPEDPQSHNLMGMIFTEQQRPQPGEYHYRRVLELSQARDPILLANLGWCLKSQGRMADARRLYEESVAAAPQVFQTWMGYFRLEEADRNFEAAGAILERLEASWPDEPSVALARAVLFGRTKRHAEALRALEAAAQQEPQRKLGPAELLEQGRLLDQMGQYDAAFATFAEGKRLARELSGNVYLDAQAEADIARLRSFFVAERLRTLPCAAPRGDTAQPIFVLGFPRSGTTLVEQTLSAHRRISAGDELPLINDIGQIMPRMLASPLNYPEALAELWMGDQREGLDNLRDYYLQKVAQMRIVGPGAAWFTDKMPLNEMHLGLIALLFPQSPLIHVIRHPLDVMVSAMSNLFTHGYFCAGALETAARHYVRIMDLVAHYRSQMALRYLALRYEDMVENQEASVRRLLDFVGEDYDPACLRFEDNRRYARTASYAQVTEKLYDRSRFRYRHYLKPLEPALPILEPVIRKLGYSVD